jgi:AraC-like DNA-binding protein
MFKETLPVVTIGKIFYPGYRLRLWHTPEETFRPSAESGERFKIIFLENGGGLLEYGGRRRHASAPSVFCLNETEQPALDPSPTPVKAQAVYFHPEVIREGFTLENAHTQSENPEWQDQKWLLPFLARDGEHTGLIHLGPGTASRLGMLFTALGRELATQPDDGWPCRSRSYFFEILFLLQRLHDWGKYFRPDLPEIGEPAGLDSDSQARAVIEYLHTHYPEKLTLEDLAREFLTNRTTLERVFRGATGMPAMAYLARLRVQLAAVMLRDTEMDLPTIVARMGFSDAAQFRRAFRRHLGYSPSEYRKRFNWMIH